MLHLCYSLTKAEQAMKTSLLERLTELGAGQGKTPHPWALLKQQQSQWQTDGKHYHHSWTVVTIWLEQATDLQTNQKFHRKIDPKGLFQ